MFGDRMAVSTTDDGGGAASYVTRKRKRTARKPTEAQNPSLSQWRKEREHRNYSSKLLDAIRLVRTPAAAQRSRAVRHAADRALAAAARGRTRWSRAILSSRVLRLKARKPRIAPRRDRSTAAAARARPARTPAVEKKARVLGRLVPGCRKLQLPKLLEETSDYIAALEMQVRAMTALAAALSVGAPAAADRLASSL